jgi:hypothetical protein
MVLTITFPGKGRVDAAIDGCGAALAPAAPFPETL